MTARDPVQRAFASAVQRKLSERGWSQSELARRIGIKPATINAMLAGRYATRSRTMSQVVQALGCEIDLKLTDPSQNTP